MNRTELTHTYLAPPIRPALLAGFFLLLLTLIIAFRPAYAAPTAISISKTVDNSMPMEGDTIVWTITVSSTESIAPVLTDTLPAGLTFVSAATNNTVEGTDVVQDGANLIWQPQLSINGTLGASPAILIVTTTLDAGTASLDAITNTVTADSGESSSAVIAPQAGGDLTIIKTVNNDNPEILETIEFNIILTDTIASTPIITETLPDGLTLSSFTNNNIFRPTQTIDDRTIVWQPRVDPTLSTLNYPARLTVFAIVDRNSFDDFGPVITNTAVTDSGLDASAAITVQDPGDQPSIKIDKEPQGLTPDFLRNLQPNDTISYTFTIFNDGDFPLFDVEVEDTAIPNIICEGTEPITLDLGETVVCSGEYRITQANIDDLEVTNTATGFGTTTDGIRVDHSDKSVASLFAPPVEPDFTIVQMVDNPNPSPGDTVVFTVAITDTVLNAPEITLNLPDGFTYVTQRNNNINERSTRLENGLIWRPLIDPNDPNVSSPAVLTVTATVDDDAASLGTVTVIANTTEGEYGMTEFVFDSSVQLTASLVVTKTVLGTTASSIDRITLEDEIRYEIEVANTGTAALLEVTVIDTLVPEIECDYGQITALNVGASFSCTLTHIVTEEDVENRRVDNTATVTGMSSTGEEASASTDLRTEIQPTAISLNSIGGHSASLLQVVLLLLTAVAATIILHRTQS